MTNQTQTDRLAEVLDNLAASDEVQQCLAIRSPLNRAIYAVVHDYRCSNMTDEDGNHYPLVDLLSNEPPADIGTGEMEMISLVDDITEAVMQSLSTDLANAEAALHKAIAWFDEYAVQHERKATETSNVGETLDRLEKSKRNKARADELRAALNPGKESGK